MGVFTGVAEAFGAPRRRVEDVSLAVTMPKLPSPPYPPGEEPADGKKQRKQKILPEEKVKVRVGDAYDFITNGTITKIRVEKIWQDGDGNTYVVISQRWTEGRRTHALHISEFKQRCIAGGIPEVHI